MGERSLRRKRRKKDGIEKLNKEEEEKGWDREV
jgi:hypothetical protein